MDEETKNDLLGLTVEIVAAHVANNRVGTAEVPELIAQVHGALAGLAAPAPAPEPAPEPAVPVRSSVKHDYIICLEDGKKLKMLKRYLRTNYGMTPEQYRQKWNLPRDYPMVAPAYAEQRRGLAEKIGLGRKSVQDDIVEPAPEAVTETPPPAPKKAPARRTKAAADTGGSETPAPKPRGRPRKATAPADA